MRNGSICILANCIIAPGFLIVNEFSESIVRKDEKQVGATEHIATICSEIRVAAGNKKGPAEKGYSTEIRSSV